MPGINVPGVRVPQLLQIDFSWEHNCITSKPLTAVTTAILWLPKLTPAQGLAGKPEPGGATPPVNKIDLLHDGLKLEGQFGHMGTPIQSL